MFVNGRSACGYKTTFDVYVGHLPKNIDEVKLNDVFSKFGEVTDILCRFGKGNYGYAIVKYRHKKDADRVLKEIDKVSVDGHDMEVRHAVRNSQNENGCGNMYGKPPSYLDTPSMLPVRPVNYQQSPLLPNDRSYVLHPPEYENNFGQGKNSPLIIEVLCSSVESAITFYGCPVYRCEELHNLSMKINSICPNLMRLMRKPLENRVFGALYSEDMSWYRCVVIQGSILSKPGMCVVQYIDYGNYEEVTYDCMVDLPEPLKAVPPFAAKCTLSNLVCSLKARKEVSYLHHLVNQRMSLCAMPTGNACQYNILKCTCNGIDVIQELVKNGFAVYKNQKNPSQTPVPDSSRPIKSVHPPPQECNKPAKKANDKVNSKKMNGIVEHPLPNMERSSPPTEAANSMQILKKPPVPEASRLVNSDFTPKKIIKRGSHIDVDFPHGSEEMKGKDTVNQLLKIDCVLSSLKLVNNVRALVSLNNDVTLITSAVELLMNETDVKPSEELANEVKETYREYNNVLNEIKNCTDQSLLNELKSKRELQKNVLCSKLDLFLKNFDSSILEKQKTIQQMITDLESNSNAWMNVYLSSQPATIEELLEEYNKAKEQKWNAIQTARDTTNEMHKKFMEFLSEFQKEFTLNMIESHALEDTGDQTFQLTQASGKKGSYAVKFEESLSNLGSALEEEMKICTMNKGRSSVSVIQCILDKIDVPKEKIDAACEIYEKYKELYNDLVNMTDLNIVFEALAAVQREISILTSCSLENGTGEANHDREDHFAKLHLALSKEDALLETLAKASALHHPELVLEHPELNLAEYQGNWYLIKPSWKPDYFPILGTCSRVESSSMSKFCDHQVVIKEFRFDSEFEKVSFLKKAVVWNEIKSKALTKVQALFYKDEKTVCAILPHISRTLYDNPLPITMDRKAACNILQQILLGLKDIHARGMAHGAVHPLAILHHDKEVLLDFNYNLKLPHDKLLVKGINFQAPHGDDMCKSADMYGFGCLVLWILFPNLSFTSTQEGPPNISAFQSILESMLSRRDFLHLSSLLNMNPNVRPSSRTLLSSGFLKDLRILPTS